MAVRSTGQTPELIQKQIDAIIAQLQTLGKTVMGGEVETRIPREV
jgi:hypothetical protein